MAAIASREQRPVTARTVCPTDEAGAAAGGAAEGCSGIDGEAACCVDSVARRGDRVGASAAEASAAWTGGERESTDDGDGSARDRGSVGGEGEQEQAHSGCEAAQLSVL